MHTIYAAPVCLSAPISHRCAPLFHVRIDRDGAIMNMCSYPDTGVVGAVSDIDRLTHLASSTRRRWRYRRAANALSQSPVSNRATLAAERPYLHLCRRDEIAAAVAAFDQRIEPCVEPAHTVPLERGKLEKFPDFVGGDRMLYRYSTRTKGTPMLFNLPSRICTTEAELLIRELCDIAEVEDGG